MKKAEVQMQETIMVIFIVTIIIALGLFVFYRYNANAIDQIKLEYEQIKAYSLLATLPNNPQLQYTSQGNPENALDTLKLLNVNLDYIGFKEITIKQIYPETENKTCSTLNYPNCNLYKIYSKLPTKVNNVNIITTPVSLYFPLTKESKAAVLEIKWYY
ncbi:MAG: hypothetical protein AABX61_01835 [Nanoarchaeota archaeon]